MERIKRPLFCEEIDVIEPAITTGAFPHLRTATLAIVGILFSLAAHAAGIPTLDTVEVNAETEDLVGTADTASVGTVTHDQLQTRPVYRASEVLEVVPGLIVTQHSGEGKANQYFLRGFNLDHGTDLRTSVDGMLVNQRSHGHGQGWTDLNFLIPELATGLQYKKGPYFADEGDFASAGAVSVNYADTLSQGIAEFTGGENDYRRLLAADSVSSQWGNLLGAFEYYHNDGPWDNPEHFDKYNGVLRYSRGDAQNGFNITAMAYSGKGNATNQIAKRAVDRGIISRLGSLDPSDGSDSSRYSLSAAWRRTAGNTVTHANAYVINWNLDLFSNFTYFLDDPVNGDQFQQSDDRVTSAANLDHTWFVNWGGRAVENTIGLQFQNDNIFNNLLRTRARELLSTVRRDHIVERNVSFYLQNRTQWFEKFRTVAGVRADFYHFDVNSNNQLNSGTTNDNLGSPNLSLIFGPWAKTEYYASIGGGFHSNDARGTTITVHPVATDNLGANLPAAPVPGLVRSWGYELGVRTALVPHLQSSLALYILDFDSELVFLGDAGTTEAGRASRRIGIEFANFYTPAPWLTLDADFSFARARFRDDPEGIGDRIPGAVEGVGKLGVTVDNLGPYFGSVELRYFGPRALIEDNSARSSSTTIVNARVGYKLRKDLRVALECFNLFDSEANAIDYFYTSRLQGEAAAGVNDFHFHPIEPRSIRVGIQFNF